MRDKDETNGLGRLVFQAKSLRELIITISFFVMALGVAAGAVQSWILRPAVSSLEKLNSKLDLEINARRISDSLLYKRQTRILESQDLTSEALRYNPGSVKRSEILRKLDNSIRRRDE